MIADDRDPLGRGDGEQAAHSPRGRRPARRASGKRLFDAPTAARALPGDEGRPAEQAVPPGGLTLVGLGPGPVAQLTLEARAALDDAALLLLRTAQHPIVATLPAGKPWRAFDDLLAGARTASARERAYARIVAEIVASARMPAGVVYAVPGAGATEDRSAERVLAAVRAAGLPVRVVPGLGIIDAVTAALGVQPAAAGLQVREASDLFAWLADLRAERAGRDDPRRWDWLLARARPPFDPTRPLLVLGARGPAERRRLRLILGERYPSAHAITTIATGTGGEIPPRSVPLARLGHDGGREGEYAVYVPPLAPLDAVSELTGLRTVVARLRAPGGCPWDREQTHETLKQYLVEETYEVLEAIEAGDPRTFAEELGDVLLQVVLHAQLAAESDEFGLEDVLRAITTKLVRRHPHVFGNVSVADSAEVVRNWEQIKQGEKATARRTLADSVPRHLPALAYAQAIQRKVARYGFDWPEIEGVLDKVVEELTELRAEDDDEARRREAGDVLFAIVNALRWLKIDAEEALRLANRRFGQRFAAMEDLAAGQGLALDQLSPPELDALWEQAKQAERAGSPAGSPAGDPVERP